uniref:Uncharacterized protein n=1 Tax=Glossina palpalis gambiensis TaxID=67801 RepID=A0A1B0AYB3_9MUSC
MDSITYTQQQQQQQQASCTYVFSMKGSTSQLGNQSSKLCILLLITASSSSFIYLEVFWNNFHELRKLS